ncbi:MAG TPA: ABC transporter permease [Saprospiraceae bacterium]|nr:ABC transporter permease [Saprospiraceae bacterium]
MVFKIAWRNIWRNKMRSMVVIMAIIIGVIAVIFLSGFSLGMGQSYVQNAIENEVSHLQIHHPKFKEDKEIQYSLSDGDKLLENLKKNKLVKVASLRTIVSGMISSSRGVRGVQIKGILPDEEALLTNLRKHLIEGQYFKSGKNSGILVSKRLAEKLKLKLRKKISLRFQDEENNLVEAGFRVVGIFETDNRTFDEANVFVRKDQISKYFQKKNATQEAALLLHDIHQVENLQASLQKQYPNLSIENYKQISPEIELFNSQIKLSSSIFTFIVMLGLIFGIINTMLMAVLERIRELGMLMAIGMNKVKVFSMIVIETILLGIISAPIGLLLGYLLVNKLNKTGIDLSRWSSGMKEFGLSGIVYPLLDHGVILQLALAVFITAFLASLYPAFKAIQLRPVEAVRTI